MASYFGLRKQEEDDQLCPSLTLQQRIIGFGICAAVGFLLGILAWMTLFKVIAGKPYSFAICFSLANVVSIAGSGFLVGFKRQIKSMFDKKRWITTTIYLGALVMTLICALVFKNAALTLIFLIVEVCAYIWYGLSYIPFGQKLAVKICGTCCED
ncbi:unnamed protein product [Blepharisma stoltei]|uniref:Vesicle transport protein n=1 Tax=Blepharisma stoltei TaxID=1481888 RepID=A0AAU9J197_9CILI|nr:unnamed protein product [Blepharisma stoltei]